mmetsp:Transcript_49145/g.106430  ORF Transcript_49145/g.106430 Transcript_49145/m.106430 type:complete len:352 (+) Transcript_49145:333-1388(+)
MPPAILGTPAAGSTIAPREAVVLVSDKQSECHLHRISALAQSSGDRDVLLFFNGSWTYPRPLPSSVQLIQQLTPRPELASFGDNRNLLSKPSFLEWLATQGTYTRVWHLEDDALFTAPWHELFDSHASSSADLLGYLQDVTKGDMRGYKQSCRLNSPASGGMTRCYAGGAREPCANCWTSWPVLRISKKLAQAVYQSLLSGSTGHHEAICGPVCVRRLWCSREKFNESLLKTYFLGGEIGFKRASNASNRMTLHGINRYLEWLYPRRAAIYHPAKCEAGAELGKQQLAAIRWRPDTPCPPALRYVKTERHVGAAAAAAANKELFASRAAHAARRAPGRVHAAGAADQRRRR